MQKGRKEVEDDPYRQELPSMMDFFGKAVVLMQDYSGLPSSELMVNLGREMGRAIGAKMTSDHPVQLMYELSELWEKLAMARLQVVSEKPLRFMTDQCIVCGQVAGIPPFRCYFHEGVFQGILDQRIGKGHSIRQLDVVTGDAGTLSRRFEIAVEKAEEK